jgi:F-type H+-transporting ATPase subunit alpha
MSNSVNSLIGELQQKVDDYSPGINSYEVGKVLEVGDGIAHVTGIQNARSQELVEFENGQKGIVFNLEEDKVGVIILGDFTGISVHSTVKSTGKLISVPVGSSMLGRIVNALGEPIDGKGPITSTSRRPIERIAPGVLERQDVDTPVQTGIIAIDAMIPIGRGQRELIIGDRQTGKTAIALDTIINQKDENLICIYVAIGQKKSTIARTVSALEKIGAMKYTVVVSAPADDSASMQYIAPYAGCAIGEEFMENGQDALIIYDDLSKHAWAYREVSLLLRRPPGREAYPGDIFYLHSRLLERASRLCNKYTIEPLNDLKIKKPVHIDNIVFSGPKSLSDAENARNLLPNPGEFEIRKIQSSGGSLTALPIVETLLGDVSAYIPTNIISITDGQIYLENSLFNAGIRPAINIGISVSRVGSSAQTKAMKQVAGRLRLDMANFRELAAFTKFDSALDKATQAQLNRGLRLQEVLKQQQYKPIQMCDQVIILYAATNGFADNIPATEVKEWCDGLLKNIKDVHPELRDEIIQTKKISSKLEEQIKDAITQYNQGMNY